MAKKKDNQKLLDLLATYCNEETTTEIDCTKCNAHDSDWTDQYDAAERFYKEGWRATENNCYCPKCAKKYLKNTSNGKKKTA